MSSPEVDQTRFDAELSRSIDRLSKERSRATRDAVDHPVDATTPPTLTIGLATYDDFDGAYFTVTSLLLHHAEAMRRCEIVILDNHPEGVEAEPLHALASEYSSPPVRYVPYDDVRSTAVRDVLFAVARTPWVLVVDSHVLIAPGALDTLLAYIDAHPTSKDLIQGPLIRANGEVAATHMDPKFGGGMFGVWGIDDRGRRPDGEPFEIPLHGLALFAMRADCWPGINRRFTGFGGEEGYVHERVRQNGGITVCLPGLRWHHRFARPRGIPYPMNFADRVNNYLVGWRELGRDPHPIHQAFSGLLGDREYARLRGEVERRLDHPGDATAICIASDDDRVGPWRSVLAEADRQALTIHRIPLSRTEHEGDWWDRAIENAAEVAERRRWNALTVIDERLGAPPDLLSRLRTAEAKSPTAVLRGSLAGEPVLISVPESVRATPGELRTLLKDPSRVVDIELDGWAPFGTLSTAEQISAGWTINDAADFALWEPVYLRWVQAGLNQTMHRLPALVDAAPELQQAFGLAEALSLAAGTETPVIVARSDIWLSEDTGPLLSALLRELETLDHGPHLVSLSTPEGGNAGGSEGTVSRSGPPAGGDFFRSALTPDSGVLLIRREGVSLLAERLPPPDPTRTDLWASWLDEWESVDRWLAALVSEGVLDAGASVPCLAVTHDRWKLGRPATAGRMQR